MIFNTDLALVKLLCKYYNNPRIINTRLLHLRSQYMLSELINRNNINPLTLFLKDEYYNNADELYNQFMTEKYDEVLKYSEDFRTLFSEVLKFLSEFEEFTPIVICKDDKQKKLIDTWKESINISSIIFNKGDKLPNFDIIILRTYNEVNITGWFEGKNFYLSNERYNNISINKEASNVLIKFGICNELRYISLYKDDMYKIIKG